jgi:hypothetical protein
LGDRDGGATSVVSAVGTVGARRELKSSIKARECREYKMIVSLENIENDLDQTSVVVLSLLIGVKTVYFSASIEDCDGIESVNFERDLYRILTYVSGDVQGTQAFIRAVIAFHNGKNIDLPITLGNLELTPTESIIFADYK